MSSDVLWVVSVLQAIKDENEVKEEMVLEALKGVYEVFDEIVNEFVNVGGIDVCKYVLVQCDGDKIVRYALRMVSKIAMMSDRFYRKVIRAGLITDIVKVMDRNENRKVKTSCARLLACLVTDQQVSIFEEFINAGAMTALLSQLQISGDVLLLETSKALTSLAKIEDVAKTLVEQGIISQMVGILEHNEVENMKIKENAIQIIQRLVKFHSLLPMIQNDLLSLVSALIEQTKNEKLKKPAQNLLGKLAHHFPELPRMYQKRDGRKLNLKNTHILYIKISPNIDIEYNPSDSESYEYVEDMGFQTALKKPGKKKKVEKEKKKNKIKKVQGEKKSEKKPKKILYTPSHLAVSKLEIISKMQLHSLDDVHIKNIPEVTFIELFPLILAYVRRLTKILNDDPFSLLANGIKKKWNLIVSSVMERIQTNSKLGMLACWMEEKKLGMQLHCKKKYSDLQIYNVKPFYKSSQFHESKLFFSELGSNVQTLRYGDEVQASIPNPLCNLNSKICSIRVEKIFSSKAKPLLLSIESDPVEGVSNMIFKKGGDTRKDMLVQVVFKIFNSLWESSPFLKEDRPYIFGYKVVPLESKYSVVEYIEGCDSASTFKWKKFQFMEPSDLNRFVLTAAGAYIASWVIGIRDRHQDNMLIKDDRVFFNIDFEHIFNQKTKFNDAPRFAIHNTMKSQLLKLGQWERFKTLCAEGFSVLQNHSSMIIYLCRMLFKPIYKDINSIAAFLSDSLMVGRSSRSSKEYIKTLCDKGASSLFKTIKFMAHEMAVTQRTSARNSGGQLLTPKLERKSNEGNSSHSKTSRSVDLKKRKRLPAFETFIHEETSDLADLIDKNRSVNITFTKKQKKQRRDSKKNDLILGIPSIIETKNRRRRTSNSEVYMQRPLDNIDPQVLDGDGSMPEELSVYDDQSSVSSDVNAVSEMTNTEEL